MTSVYVVNVPQKLISLWVH